MRERRWLLVPAVMVFATMAMGAQCNTTPPACDSMPEGWECGYSSGPMYDPSLAPACLRYCAALPPEGMELGALCALDPCEVDALGHYLCPDGYSCEPLIDPETGLPDPSVGQCADTERRFGGACDPSEATDGLCPTGTYCRPTGLCPEPPLSQLLAFDYEVAAGQCWTWAREGAACDETCDLCEPGTACIDSVCRRPCELDGDCPCDTDNFDYSCEGELCTFCSVNQGTCDPANPNCCDPESGCTEVVMGGVSLGDLCCRGVGAGCADSATACCGGLECYEDECVTCIAPGEEYDPAHPLGCCLAPAFEGRMHSDGVMRCLPSCAGVGGACRTCAHADGPEEYFYECTDSGLDCPDPVFPTWDTTCDDLDDDCDGTLMPDAYVRSTCSGSPAPDPSIDFLGCPDLMLDGRSVCRNVGGMPTISCEVTEGFCAWSTIGNEIDRAPPFSDCFARGGFACETGGCLAGEWCCSPPFGGGGTLECTPIGTLNQAGLPQIMLYPPPTDCWLPDAPWLTPACPAVANCIDHDSCDECAQDMNCGWCEPYNTCLPGGDAGPMGEADCGFLNTVDGWTRDHTVPWCT